MKIKGKNRLATVFADYLMVNLGWLLFNVVRFFTLPGLIKTTLGKFLVFKSLLEEQLLVPVFIMALYALSGAYNRSTSPYRSRVDETTNAALVSLFGAVCVYFAVLANDNIPERMTIFELMASMWLCTFVPVALLRLITASRDNAFNRRHGLGLRTVVVGATESNISKLSRIIASSGHTGLKLTACVDCDNAAGPTELCGIPVIKSTDPVAICRELRADAVVVLSPEGGLGRTGLLINELYALDIPIYITPHVLNLMAVRPKVKSVIVEPLVDITKTPLSPVAVNLKRLADIILSAVALIVLSPVLALIAIAVKMDSPGPVFYRQRRIGYHKKPFEIIKFRTMRVDAETAGPALSSSDDPRVTPVGRFLRKYRLDELPQFWNVLVGQMSLVGPRPEREYYIKKIMERVPAYSLLHQVRPGITSWGMVKYGYAKNVDEMIERLPYDLLYIENLSLGVDLKILFHTVHTVLTGKGV